MSFTCQHRGVPSISSYEQALAHYDSVSVDWGGGRKPIKGRNRQREQHYEMRRTLDDSIVFRFYRTDCVTWHPDGSCTIQGYATMSTTGFIGLLSPPGVYHELGLNGCEPILTLHKGERWGSWDPTTHVHTPNPHPALVIRANDARLHYCAEADRWLPVAPDELTPFDWQVLVDLGAARKATRAYNLPEFVAAAPAIFALDPPQRATPNVDQALDFMREREFRRALAYCKQGETNTVFGNPRYGHVSVMTALASTFVDRLRARVYEREGLLTGEQATVLTAGQYKAYKAAQNRFC